MELQRALDTLSNYSTAFGLQVNEMKTKAMTFTTSRSQQGTCAPSLLLNGKTIETVNEYKYLGIIFTLNGKLTKAKATLSKQAKKVLYILRRIVNTLRYPPISVMCKLFDTLVMPVLCYGAEVWGMARSEEIEKIQYQFCKFVLQMPTRAPNAAVSAELGRLPVLLTTQLRIRILKYLTRL